MSPHYILYSINLIRRLDITVEYFLNISFSFLKTESKAVARCDKSQLQLFLESKWGAPAVTNVLVRCSSPDSPLRMLAAALPYIDKAARSLEAVEDGNLSSKKSALILALSLQQVLFRLLKSAVSSFHSSLDDSSVGPAKSLLLNLLSYILLNELHYDFIEDTGANILHQLSPSLELRIEGTCLLADFLNMIKVQTSVTRQDVGRKAIMCLADGVMDFAIVVQHSKQIIELISSESNQDYSRFIALLESYRGSST